VSVELEMWLVRLDGLVRLGVLVVVLGTNAMTTVAAVVSSSEPVMVMAVAVAVVSQELDALHVHSPSSCGHRGLPVPLVSPVPHAQAQVYHGY
jgi:Cu/Zn superoxide dismutase